AVRRDRRRRLRRRRAPLHHLVVDIVEGALVDQFRRLLDDRALLLLFLLSPLLAPLFGDYAEIERAHLPGGPVVRAQQLEDPEFRRNYWNACTPGLRRKLIERRDVDLATEDLEPSLFQLPRHDLLPVGDVLRDHVD